MKSLLSIFELSFCTESIFSSAAFHFSQTITLLEIKTDRWYLLNAIDDIFAFTQFFFKVIKEKLVESWRKIQSLTVAAQKNIHVLHKTKNYKKKKD